MDKQNEIQRIQREAEQQVLLDSLQQMADRNNEQVDKNTEMLEKVQEKIEEQTQEVKSIEDALNNASGEDLPALNEVLQGALGKDGAEFKILMQDLRKGTTELAAALRGTTIEEAERQLMSGNLTRAEFEDLVKKLGYGYNSETGEITRTDLTKFQGKFQGFRPQNVVNTPLGSSNNGSSVTGGGAQSNSNTGDGGGGGSGFPKQGRVSTSRLPLRIRSGAGLGYRVLGSIPRGASVTITGEAGGGWAKVNYNGINGYASKQFLTYDQGGIANGIGHMMKDTILPERVLSPKQTKSFDNLVNNLTKNPVLAALSKNPSFSSNLDALRGSTSNNKNYNFSNFTIHANDIDEFINSIETIMPLEGGK